MNNQDIGSNFRLPSEKRTWRGVTLQLFLVAILPLTVLVLIITFGSLTLHHKAMRSLVADRNQRAVQSIAISLSKEIEHRGKTIELISRTVGSGESSNTILSRVEADLSIFEGGVASVNASGEPVTYFGNPVIEQLVNSSDWPKLLKAIQSVKPGTSQYLPNQLINGLLYTPVINSINSDVSFVGLFLPEKVLSEGLAIFSQEEYVNILVIDEFNNILFQSGNVNSSNDIFNFSGIQNALAGKSGIDYLQTPKGEHVITTAVIQPVGWVLMNEESWEDIASPLLRATQNAPLIIIPILGLSIFALWFGLRQIVQPMRALEEKAGDLAQGNFETIRLPVGGVPEISYLQNTLIVMADKLNDAQNSLHNYIGAITNSVESERHNLARELHDDTLQSLIALGQNAQYAMHWNKDPKVEKSLEQIMGLTDQSIKNLRGVVQGLRPIYIEDLGLATALAMQSTNNKRLNGLKVHFQLEGNERRLNPDIEMALYRIAQEALNNVVHHAKAKNAWLSLNFREGDVLLEVRDDGQGFDVPLESIHYALRGHYGLLGIYERTELIGAKLIIRSTKGEGTQILVQLTDSDFKNRIPPQIE